MRIHLRFLALFLMLLSTQVYAQSDSQRARVHIDAGIQLTNQHDYPRAIQEFTQALQIYPYNVEGSAAYVYRGVAYEFLGRYQEAIEDYNLALYADAKNNLARDRYQVLSSQGYQPVHSSDPSRALDDKIRRDEQNLHIIQGQ